MKQQILPNIYYCIRHGKPPPGSCRSLRLSPRPISRAEPAPWCWGVLGPQPGPTASGLWDDELEGLACLVLVALEGSAWGGLRNTVWLEGPRALLAHTARCLQQYLGAPRGCCGYLCAPRPQAPTVLCSPLLPEALFLTQGHPGDCCTRQHGGSLWLSCSVGAGMHGRVPCTAQVVLHGWQQLRVGWKGTHCRSTIKAKLCTYH